MDTSFIIALVAGGAVLLAFNVLFGLAIGAMIHHADLDEAAELPSAEA